MPTMKANTCPQCEGRGSVFAECCSLCGGSGKHEGVSRPPEPRRVGAIQKTDAETVYLFGYGIYLGCEVPPLGTYCLGVDLHEEAHPNPKIRLDSGDIVWGCECWWGGEESVKRDIGDRKVVIVPVPNQAALADLPGKGQTDANDES